MEARDEILTEAEKGGATSGFGNPRSKEFVAVAVAVAEEEEEEDEEEKKEEWRWEFGSLDDEEEEEEHKLWWRVKLSELLLLHMALACTKTP